MDGVISNYFKNLFASEHPSGFEEAMAGLKRVLTNDMNIVMDAEPNREEIRDTLIQLHPNKAPDTLVFQILRGIVGNDVI